MNTAIFRVSQIAMPCLGLWFGLRTYAWLCAHPAVYDPLSGSVSLGVAVWLLGGALVVALSETIAKAYADARQTHTRPSFYAMLIAAASLALGFLSYLTK